MWSELQQFADSMEQLLALGPLVPTGIVVPNFAYVRPAAAEDQPQSSDRVALYAFEIVWRGVSWLRVRLYDCSEIVQTEEDVVLAATERSTLRTVWHLGQQPQQPEAAAPGISEHRNHAADSLSPTADDDAQGSDGGYDSAHSSAHSSNGDLEQPYKPAR